MNLEKLKDTARKHEQKEEWRKAIEVYQRVLDAFESGAEEAPDLALYNKVGDLHLKVGDIPAAVRSYERAVDLYGEQGFSNNAIAVCGKILRYDPHRTRTYIQLARLHARKNMAIEAKKNLIEYLERMNREGLRDDAFRDVKAFADQFASSDEIRVMLAELLRVASRGAEAREQLEKLASDLESRGDQAGAQRTRERLHELDDKPATPAAAPRRRGDLVFLDIGLDLPYGSPPAPAAPSHPVRLVEEPVEAPPALDPPVGEVTVSASDMMQADLDIDSSEFDVVPVEGLERASVDDLDDVELLPVDPDLVADHTRLEADDEAPALLEGFEPGVADDSGTVPLVATDSTGLVSDLTIDISGATADEPSPDRIEEEALLGDVDLSVDVGGKEESYIAAPPPVWSEDDPALQLTEESGGAGPAPAQELSAEARVSALEDRVLDNPDDPEVHRELGEALLAIGQHERGVEELDLALSRFEELEDWDQADTVAQELARLEPSGIRYFQKLVELAYRGGHRPRVIDSYLELGDALVRVGAVDKALAVYGRVAESDPGNARALSAIDALAPPPPPAPAMGGPPAPAARPASDDFVDLGALVQDQDSVGKSKDTRMRVQDEEPTGDEERDFAEMLKQFKRGLDENLDDEDFQSHYDLGIAFKEMGLLDEAIAEFQKALRSPDARLRTSEALGSSFFDKGQFAVAEAILRRAVDGLSGQDDEKIGLLYWLGRALEAEGRAQEAQPYYRRALAVDIHFMDLADRLRAISKGGTP
ncbi:MAG TPA: tetratricopeptide repeat protein [Gemmatimonadales bacterium]|nr:tetratricopeptide repeat protein [Gemmatimonadales bacterium]